LTQVGNDSLNTRSTLDVGGKAYSYYSLEKAAEQLGSLDRLPFSPGARADAGLHRRARVVDLAAMRDAMKKLGGDPRRSTRWCRSTSSSTTR
jgi:aconitase A